MENMRNLLFARALMGTSLGFHISYVAFGIGLPLLLFISELLALKTGNDLYHRLARGWVRPMTVLFAIGAVSGTIISFELGLLWPRFMGFSGPMIGLPFWLEAFAFFVEAIFIGLYVYGEDRLSRRALLFCTVPITIAAAASAVAVISANGWMNSPAGFSLSNSVAPGARLAGVRPWRALANGAWAHEALHGTLAAYAACSFAAAGVYAFRLLRGDDKALCRLGLTLCLAVGAVVVPLMLITGDYSAVWVAHEQPAKLAAMEVVPNTVRGAPLIIGGWLDKRTNRVRYGLPVPKMLSLLAFHDPDARVQGLDAFAPALRPDANKVHPFFDLMVFSFFVMLAPSFWFWIARWRKKGKGKGKGKDVFSSRRLLISIIIASPFGLLAQEAGWMVTEFGRQPWMVYRVMNVSSGVTPRSVEWVFVLFALVYAALTAGLLRLLPAHGRIRDDKEGTC
ncbi:MAG: cytochrome ubiquinol oxidase subunit I [Nitrospiraceae bacterium]|nr:cytochrome ubiquinol oxidase subunit I [Nitrospiraceae bacterium]